MAQEYAKNQSSGFKNRIENVAVVGATGSVGKFFVEELSKTGKHKVTAITRTDSKSSIPSGLHVAKVNYDDQSSLVKALQGQDALIITMSATAPPEQQSKLIQAAAEAGVPWVLPNEYSYDPLDKALGEETFLGPSKAKAAEEIKSLGKSSYILFVNGFWYEFSLGGNQNRFGFDFPNKTVTFYDDGKAVISTSAMPLCGQAMAKLLSLKVYPEDENDKSLTLSKFKNESVRIASFSVSQKDMFESVLRVTGESEKDWKIQHQTSKDRVAEGMKQMQTGDRAGFVQLLYARTFYPGDEGNYEKTRGTHNEALGIPKEDLDEATKRAVKYAEGGPDGY